MTAFLGLIFILAADMTACHMQFKVGTNVPLESEQPLESSAAIDAFGEVQSYADDLPATSFATVATQADGSVAVAVAADGALDDDTISPVIRKLADVPAHNHHVDPGTLIRESPELAAIHKPDALAEESVDAEGTTETTNDTRKDNMKGVMLAIVILVVLLPGCMWAAFVLYHRSGESGSLDNLQPPAKFDKEEVRAVGFKNETHSEGSSMEDEGESTTAPVSAYEGPKKSRQGGKDEYVVKLGRQATEGKVSPPKSGSEEGHPVLAQITKPKSGWVNSLPFMAVGRVRDSVRLAVFHAEEKVEEIDRDEDAAAMRPSDVMKHRASALMEPMESLKSPRGSVRKDGSVRGELRGSTSTPWGVTLRSSKVEEHRPSQTGELAALRELHEQTTAATKIQAACRGAQSRKLDKARKKAECLFQEMLTTAKTSQTLEPGVPSSMPWHSGNLCILLGPDQETDLFLCVAASYKEYPLSTAYQILEELATATYAMPGWDSVDKDLGLNSLLAPKIRELIAKYEDPTKASCATPSEGLKRERIGL